MNREERRKAESLRRSTLGKMKFRCVACDKAGGKMNKEHFWPKWLSERACAGPAGVTWVDGIVHPKSATIPLHENCNSILGKELEGKVSAIFSDLESGEGISDKEAEILIRWLWKFEGYLYSIINFNGENERYLWYNNNIDRVLGNSFRGGRKRFGLAIALLEANGRSVPDWPMGLDSPVTPFNTVFVSGVFSRIAIMSTLMECSEYIPDKYDVIELKETSTDNKEYFPRWSFSSSSEAVLTTKTASYALSRVHEDIARSWFSERRSLIITRPPPRVIIP